jgi:hypothetical protein
MDLGLMVKAPQDDFEVIIVFHRANRLPSQMGGGGNFQSRQAGLITFN